MPAPPLNELVEQFLAGRRHGDARSAETFAAAHPEHGEALLVALRAAETQCETVPAGTSDGLHCGMRIERYVLEEEIGRGGMGLVWRAREEALGRHVAMKFLPPALGHSRVLRARFEREAQVTARLSHPSICAVLAVRLDGDRPWIAMELIDGESLASRIARARREPPTWLELGAGGERGPTAIAAWFAKVARVLAHAHAGGVVHRDVKPSNLMIDGRGEPVLLDFGLARDVDPDGLSLTQSGHATGTPIYLAPELIDGSQRHPDSQTDVYALGVTLFEALALQPPFVAPTLQALFRCILEAPAPDLARQRSGVARDLAVVVATALQRERRFRYRDAAAFAADLEAFAAGRPVAAKPVGWLGRGVRWARREPRQAAGALALAASTLVAAVAAGAWLASRSEVHAAEVAMRERELEQHVSEGFSALLDHDVESADRHFFAARALAADRLEPWAGLALTSLERGARDEALARLAEAPATLRLDRLRAAARGESLDPDDSWLDGASGIELFVEGHRLLTEADALPPSQRVERAKLALARLNEAVVRAPVARAMFHVQRAYAAEAAQDLDAARSAARALLALWPDSFRELFVAGSVLVELDPKSARRLLEQAVRVEPEHLGAVNNLASACLLLDDAAAAEPLLRHAIALNDTTPQPHNGLGLALVDLHRPDEARAEYRRALELDPDLIEAWRNLGNLELGVGRPAEAERAYARAVELDPEHPECRAEWGTALLALGRANEARAAFERALERQPDLASAWSGLVRARLQDGDRDGARAALARARQQLPDDEELQALARDVERP